MAVRAPGAAVVYNDLQAYPEITPCICHISDDSSPLNVFAYRATQLWWHTDLLRPASSASLSSSSERAPETLLLIEEGMAGSCKESIHS